MAKGKYHEWLKPEGLEQITNWAAKDCTYDQIANNMGINRATFYEWLERFPDISDAIKKGRAMSITCIENMAFKLAMGEAVEEIVTKVKNPDGSESVVIKKRKIPPNSTMLIFLLKNKAGYRDNPPDESCNEILKDVDNVLISIKRTAENA